MTGVNFASSIRFKTRTNLTTLTDADIVLLANEVKDEFAEEIIKADEDYFGTPATRDLVASDADDITAREYSLPEDFLGMIRAQALFNGTDAVELEELNLPNYKKPITETDIINNFTNEPKIAKYDILRQSLWLYSGTVEAVTAGLLLFYNAYPADISVATLAFTTDLSIPATSTSFAIPRPFHELWARKVAIKWKSSRQKPIPLTEQELNFDDDFRKKMQTIINPNQSRETLGTTPYDDGSQY